MAEKFTLGERRILCEGDSVARTITFHIRDGFGDGMDEDGLKLTAGAEREGAIREFAAMLDALTDPNSGADLVRTPIQRTHTVRI